MSVATAPGTARAPERRSPGREDASRHLRVVRAPRRRIGRLLTTLVLGALFVVLLGTVAFHVHLVQGQQRIDRLNQQAEVAQARYDDLRVTVDRLSSPSRIVHRARALGMTEATDPTWLAPIGPHAGQQASDGSSLQRYLDLKPYLRGSP